MIKKKKKKEVVTGTLNWDLLQARLKSHYEAWSNKKKTPSMKPTLTY